MKLFTNFNLPDSCTVYMTDRCIKLTTFLAISTHNIGDVLLKKYKPFISGRCGYIQLTKIIKWSDCNQQSMLKHYRASVEELMVASRKVKVEKLLREITTIKSRQLELNL